MVEQRNKRTVKRKIFNLHFLVFSETQRTCSSQTKLLSRRALGRGDATGNGYGPGSNTQAQGINEKTSGRAGTTLTRWPSNMARERVDGHSRLRHGNAN